VTIYKTSTGVTLEIVRIPRSLIDAYAHNNPTPEPPTIEVPGFGGVPNQVENLEDQTYLAQLNLYNLTMAQLEFDLVVQAVNILDPDWKTDLRVADMISIGIPIDSTHEYLRYIALTDAVDLGNVTEEFLYLSTVTDRGIKEAEQAFGIEWQGAPLRKHSNPPGRLRAASVYQSRVAATSLGYTWEQFCELPGPDQSAAVAQYQATCKVEYLASEERKT